MRGREEKGYGERESAMELQSLYEVKSEVEIEGRRVLGTKEGREGRERREVAAEEVAGGNIHMYR